MGEVVGNGDKGCCGYECVDCVVCLGLIGEVVDWMGGRGVCWVGEEMI